MIFFYQGSNYHRIANNTYLQLSTYIRLSGYRTPIAKFESIENQKSNPYLTRESTQRNLPRGKYVSFAVFFEESIDDNNI